MRLYVTPDSKVHVSAVELLRAYGLSTTLQQDKRGYYLDVEPPEYWKSARRTNFKEGIEQLGKDKIGRR